VADYNTLSGPRTDVATGAYTYDNGNRLTGLAYTDGGGAHTIDTFGWGYDAANRVTSFTSNDGTATYGYDLTNQLTSATYTTNSGGHQPANESYSFDHNGNRNMTGWTTGAANLMTSDGTFNYQHDADGNQTVRTRISTSYAADHQTTYSWDYRNRLTDVQYYDNNGVLTKHVHYVYDVFDHLIETEVDPTGGGTYTQIAHYALDVSPGTPAAGVPGLATAQPVLQFDGNGSLTTRYLEAVDRIFAQGAVPSPTQPDTVTWDLVDNLGTVRDVADNNSSLVDHVVYNSFGQVGYESAPSVAHFAGFTGGHVDQNTGLVNNYERWYDPGAGRWLSADPLGFLGEDANLSRYAGNNPATRVDPRGLSAQASAQDQEQQAMQNQAQQGQQEAKIGQGKIINWLKAQKQQMQADMQEFMKDFGTGKNLQKAKEAALQAAGAISDAFDPIGQELSDLGQQLANRPLMAALGKVWEKNKMKFSAGLLLESAKDWTAQVNASTFFDNPVEWVKEQLETIQTAIQEKQKGPKQQ
jgi:RHS repeat-associated protein